MKSFNPAKFAGPLFLLAMMLLASLPAHAQTTDFAGEWSMRCTEDFIARCGGGEQLGDYLGIPLNAAGRMRAETSDVAEWGLPEFQCRPHPSPYQWRAQGNMRITKEVNPVSRELTAYHVAWLRSLDRPIYMDGRPHPPAYAPHTWSGFSTGVFDGNTLVITTTHMKQGYLKDNDVPLSDQATMMEYWTRHDNIMTIVEIVNDPIYLEEPYILSSNYEIEPHTLLEFFPCTVIEENVSTKVPHYLPGKNPYLNDWLKQYGVPEEPARKGGADIMYPEYRLKMKKSAN
jgi:hypothetical protein